MKNNGINIASLQALVQKFKASEKENFLLPLQARVKWLGGLKHEIQMRDFSLLADEPEFLGGTDTGANPLEYILGALGSCMGIVYIMKAAEKGVKIEDLDITAEGELDLRVILGLKEGSRGFSEINLTFTVKSPAETRVLQEIYEEVISSSPVGYTLLNNISLSSNIKKM